MLILIRIANSKAISHLRYYIDRFGEWTFYLINASYGMLLSTLFIRIKTIIFGFIINLNNLPKIFYVLEYI
jgi:hypothetical protein